VVIAAGILIVVLLVGVVGYAVAGYALATSRISDAASAINTLNAHRSYVNTTFDLLDQQVTALNSTSDLKAGKSNSAQVVTESQTMSTTVATDDHMLMTARSRLNDQAWLTALNQARLTDEASRVGHAHRAIATAKSAAGDYVLFGQFLQAYYQALIDWATLVTDAKTKDIVGVLETDNTLQSDVDKALQMSNAPGLPTEFHEFLTDVQAIAGDYRKVFNAALSGSQSTYQASLNTLTADITKADAVDFGTTTAKIQTYYKHYRTDFNSEMDRAMS
jgi:hypothetical protein